MCGIAGFLDTTQGLGNEKLKAIVSAMADALRHRGPDAGGSWVDERAGIALGHRRLSILDLSHEGDQPMFSSGQQYVIVFNGEIYNFEDIRKEIESEDRATVRWRGHSDTEVMLAAFERWGIEAAVTRFVGMFSFALWDRRDRVLWLVRDRLGEKPLYYGWMGSTFLFASELKSFVAHPDFVDDVNRDALALYLRHNYVPAPHCIYRGLLKLPPGTLLKVSANSGRGQPLIPTAYWSVREAAENGISHGFEGSESEAIRQLDAVLRKTIKDQMVADVPLGAFLSGGVDSSTVVALMQAQSARPVKTFTIGFHEKSYNEAENAAAVANHLKTEHRDLYVSPQDAMAVIPKLPILYDEPFSDSSQIPTFLVSEMTRRYVTVSLSGDGGDELFGGYTRYLWALRIWKNIRWLPVSARTAIASALGLISPKQWDNTMLSRLLRQRRLGDRASKLAELLSVRSTNDLYFQLVSHWTDPELLVAGAHEPATALTDQSKWANLPDFESRMMYLDSISYLPDDIMQKVDRAGMAVSLESRTPFLDHRVVEFSWRLPMHMKIRRGESKWLLRQVLYQYVPKELIERPKMGFGVPIDSWLRGPLKEWAEALLDEKRLRTDGFFYPEPILQKWKEHVSGARNWQYHLWDILMFQAWLDCWKTGARAKARDYMLA
jgi:asparagine synthase (glutamine-hydrolysing)